MQSCLAERCVFFVPTYCSTNLKVIFSLKKINNNDNNKWGNHFPLALRQVHRVVGASSLWFCTHILCLTVLPILTTFYLPGPEGIQRPYLLHPAHPGPSIHTHHLPVSPGMSLNTAPGLCCLHTCVQLCPDSENCISGGLFLHCRKPCLQTCA